MKDWVFLPQVRQKILRWWHIGTALLLLCFIAQTVGGVVEDVLLPVWGWWAVCTLPVLALLHVAAWLNINPAKIIHPGAVRGFTALVVGYLTLLLLTFLLSRAAVDSNDFEIDRYYFMSLGLLLPLEGLILGGCWLLFYKRENVIRPSPQVIQHLAAGKSKEAVQQGHSLQAQCYEQVKANDLPQAFELMRQHFGTGHVPLIMIQSQHKQLEEARMMGTIAAEEAQLTLNRITVSTLYLIHEINA